VTGLVARAPERRVGGTPLLSQHPSLTTGSGGHVEDDLADAVVSRCETGVGKSVSDLK
jgi:hypothetical protein